MIDRASFGRAVALGALFLSLGMSEPVSRAEMGFYRPDDLPAEHVPAGLDAAFAASVWLQKTSDAPFAMQCSGTILSHDGYVLTPLQCVEGCPGDPRYVEFFDINDPTPSRYVLAVTRTPDVICGRRVPSLGIERPKLVFIGRGEVNFDDTKISGVAPASLQKLAEISSDYAILKFETSRALPCVPVAKAPVKAGDPVWGIGTPLSNVVRPNGFNATARNKHVRYGTASQTVSANSSYIQHGVPASEMAKADEFYSNTGRFFANLDVVQSEGEGGGAIVNALGELVGMVTLLEYVDPDSTFEQYMENVVIAERADRIRSDVEAVLGAEKAQQIFNCR
jgi:hypothetical protein